jgi:hypothetical protein
LIIAASHEEFGLAHGNYEEFRFFTGLRQSEQIALTIYDCDLVAGKISINKAVVYRRHKNRTKTGVDREITLCGRALDVLKRQLSLREELRRVGKIDHDLVFFDEDGAPIINLSYPYRRWGYVLESRKVRYREPYNARHSCVSWRLMAGHNVMLVAEEDGHSVATMLKTYAAWTKGATAADVEIIKRAMECAPLPPSLAPSPGAPRFSGFDGIRPPLSPEFATKLPPRRSEGRLSSRGQRKNWWRRRPSKMRGSGLICASSACETEESYPRKYPRN